ncbi:MAG: BatD family protein [bacterium]
MATGLGLWGLLGLLLWPAGAAAVKVEAEVDRSRVSSGEQITLTVTVAGAFQGRPDLIFPAIEGVDVFSGPSTEYSANINGRLSATFSSTYYLQVYRDNSFEIPALEVLVDGERYSSHAIPVEVVRGGEPSDSTAGMNRPEAARSPTPLPRQTDPPAVHNTSQTGGKPGDEVFITAEVDRQQAYVGQQIVLVFRFHRRIQVWNLAYNAPRTEGFWREDLPPERNYLQVISGHQYRVAEIRYALFPTRPGQLVVEPAEVTFRRSRSLSLFNQRSDRQIRLLTDRLQVQVDPLPTPRPDNFSGVVSNQLSLITEVNRTEVPRGEPVVLSVALTADGFLKSMERLPITVPETVRLHDSVEKFDADKSGDRLLSRYSVEKVLVPTEEGAVTLPPVTVTYFNPSTHRYETAQRTIADLRVLPSDLPVAGDDADRIARAGIERLSRDLAFVHLPPERLRWRAQPLPATLFWWGMVVFPGGLLLLFRWYLARTARERLDPAARRSRIALTEARRQLATITSVPDRDAGLALVTRVIFGYVADRTARSAPALSVVDVHQYASELGKAEIGQQLGAIVEACYAEQYGGRESVRRGVEGGVEPKALALSAEKLLGALAKGTGKAGPRGSVSTQLWFWLLAGLLLVSPLLLLSAARATELVSGWGPDPARLLAEGNQAYTGGDMETALQQYRTALAAGVNDPVLHYNLGNVYARHGELGRAILCYLRAQRLAPRDEDIRNNLAWVRTHTRDQELAPGDLPPLVRYLAGLVTALSIDEWSVFLLIAVWLLCGLLGWVWYRGVYSDILRRFVLACAGILCLLVAVVGWLWYQQELRDQAVVVIDEVEVRSGPATTFPVVFRIHDGLSLTIRGQRENWMRIGLGGEWVGWVPAGSVERICFRPGATGGSGTSSDRFRGTNSGETG